MGRQRIWRVVAIGVLATSMLAVRPAPALACSCASGSAPVDVVFVGRAVAVVNGEWARGRLDELEGGFGSRIALLDAELTWQGSRQPFFIVIGGPDRATA